MVNGKDHAAFDGDSGDVDVTGLLSGGLLRIEASF